MTDAITDSAGLSGPVSEAKAPRKRSVGSTATKKVAEKVPVENVSLSEQGAPAEENNVITGPKTKKAPRKSNVKTDSNNTIGSQAADNALAKAPVVEKEPMQSDDDKTALWSRKNIRWGSVGSLASGYNIVTKEAAEKWLTLNGVREATPEEVATYYGK